jgi:hypothetical protein
MRVSHHTVFLLSFFFVSGAIILLFVWLNQTELAAAEFRQSPARKGRRDCHIHEPAFRPSPFQSRRAAPSPARSGFGLHQVPESTTPTSRGRCCASDP